MGIKFQGGRRIVNDSTNPATALALGFHPGRGELLNVSLTDGRRFEASESKLMFTIQLTPPIAANKHIDVTWQSTARPVTLRDHLWLPPNPQDKREWALLDDPVTSFRNRTDDFNGLMDEWQRSIQGTTVNMGRTGQSKKQQQMLFFLELERAVHPKSDSTTKKDAETLTLWLWNRCYDRALAAREGRPLGGSPACRQRQSAPLPEKVLSAAINLEKLVYDQVETLSKSSNPRVQAAELDLAFDAFCVGSLHWRDEWGIPDSPQVALFAEMAILFRELGLHVKLWTAALPALVRGIDIYLEMAWTGTARSDSAYTIEGYQAAHTVGVSPRAFPQWRLEGLRQHRPRKTRTSRAQQAQLEYELGCLCLHMLRDDMHRRSAPESIAHVDEARHATLKTYIRHLADNPIRRRR